MIKNTHIIHNVHFDTSGRYIMIDISMNERRFTLFNIYAPNQDDPNFIKDIINVKKK